MRIVKSRELIEKELASLENRWKLNFEGVTESVQKIIEDVKAQGDRAVQFYAEKFDGFSIPVDTAKVSSEEIEEGYGRLSEEEIEAIRKAGENIRKFHAAQLEKLWLTETADGVFVGQILKPLDKVGIYVPGGRARYPSTALMTAVPAKVAGVNQIIMCTPPSRQGKIDPATLVAANEAGVDIIYKIGGAQAIAAMAYGTETVPKVEKIFGPGNIYVTAAKFLVSRDVAIDLPAGPSEILVLADDYANPKYVALDLVSQAEHDPRSMAVLIATSENLAMKVSDEIDSLIQSLDRKDVISQSLENNGLIIIVEKLAEAIKLVNRIAPEHLEVQTADPFEIVGEIRNAGAIFLGAYSPCAIGDYAAGLSHVLPTGGYSKIYSGLSVRDFMKASGIVYCTKDGLRRIANVAVTLANLEGFSSHARSILARESE